MSRSEGYRRFSDAEYKQRWAALEVVLDQEGLDGLLIAGRKGSPEVSYYSNWLPTREAYLIGSDRNDARLLVQLRNHVAFAREASVIADVVFGGWASTSPGGGPDSIPSIADELRARGWASGRVGIAGPFTPDALKRLGEVLPDISLVDISRQVGRLRRSKSDEELEWLREAARVPDEVLLEFQERARPGMTEFELVGLLEYACRRREAHFGVRHLLSTSMADPDILVPAQSPSIRRLSAGDVVVIEMSAGWPGYFAQSIRSCPVGCDLTGVFVELHDAAVATFHSITETLAGGASVGEIWQAAALIRDRGFSIEDDLVHGANQASPIIRLGGPEEMAQESTFLSPGDVVVVQPNVVDPPSGAGVQIGEMVRVTAMKVERLHSLPLEPLRIG